MLYIDTREFFMQRKSKYSVGQEFSNSKRLIELVGSDPKFRTSRWKWQCIKCNSIHGPSLINSITRLDRFPKCCFLPKKDKSGRWLGYEEMTGVFLGSYRYNALKRGYEWNVTPEQLWSVWLKQEGKCKYTGRSLVHGVDASIDRIDNSKGYILENIQWIHRDINVMKMDLDEGYFLQLCKEVTENKSV